MHIRLQISINMHTIKNKNKNKIKKYNFKTMEDRELVKYITIKEASRLLGVSALTLRNWDKKKKLLAYRHPINNYRVYREDELKNFLQTIEKHGKPKKIDIEVIEDDDIGQNDILEI